MIDGIDHVELHVRDAAAVAAALRRDYGFAGPDGLLRHGPVALKLTSGADAAGYVRRHGDGVARIAFRTADVRAAFEMAVAAGASPIVAPRDGIAEVSGFGDVTHRLVKRLVPGSAPCGPGAVFSALDHVAVCLPPGQLEATVRFYRDGFGLSEVFDERIEVNGQAMISKVVQDPGRAVTFTLIEPDPSLAPGQIDQFLAAHGGAGVQHLALGCGDIVAAVRTLAGRGVEFLTAPDGYYRALGARLGELAIPVDVLRELNLLADRDRWGQLFQIFTRSTHERHTFFIELIERRGALTFGSGNIKALYAALDSEDRDDYSASVRPALRSSLGSASLGR
ncbi:MAG TPA: VOC family protein [Streptosporangiaceae bacterium]|nr:VOC family protein [Streptosporangiaceae bacterium]